MHVLALVLLVSLVALSRLKIRIRNDDVTMTTITNDGAASKNIPIKLHTYVPRGRRPLKILTGYSTQIQLNSSRIST